MSRLKGAVDLGITPVPSGVLNYRGAWTAAPSPAYAPNDVVSYNGVTYLSPIGAGVAPPLTASAGGNGAAQNLVVTLPTTFSPGDLLIFAQVDSGDTLTSIPSGWTQTAAVSPGGTQLLVHTKIATAADIGATITWGWSNTDNGSRVWEFRAYSGVLDTVASSANPATTSANDPTVTPTSYPATIVHIGGVIESGTGATVTPPALNHVNAYSNTNARAIGAADETLASGTSTARGWVTGGSTTGNLDLVTLAVRPATTPTSGGWIPLTAAVENVNTVAASGTTQTLPDVSVATMHNVTLTGNVTITLPTPGAGKSFTVRLAQDATGGRTATWATPSGAIRWPGGTAPTITSAANAVDVVTFACIDGTNWLGFVAGQAFA